jgi:hypothetical protein
MQGKAVYWQPRQSATQPSESMQSPPTKSGAAQRVDAGEMHSAQRSPAQMRATRIHVLLQFVDALRRFLYDELLRAVSSVG